MPGSSRLRHDVSRKLDVSCHCPVLECCANLRGFVNGVILSWILSRLSCALRKRFLFFLAVVVLSLVFLLIVHYPLGDGRMNEWSLLSIHLAACVETKLFVLMYNS